MATILSAFSLSYIEVTLFSIILVTSVVSYIASQRHIKRLEDRLLQTQAMLSREIKMVNQGAIGVGRRFAQVEKKLHTESTKASSFAATQSKPAEKSLFKASKFAQIQELAAKSANQTSNAVSTAPNGLTTKAEQTLTSWLKEHQTA